MDSTQHETPKIKEVTDKSCFTETSNFWSNFTSIPKLEDSLPCANTDDNGSDKETEVSSFVVLGKDSLDAIQASSLASYVDIQQKSMSVDYDTMVSSLATNEIHKKLADLLQENMKLKETLKQNNFAMKRQLNTMVLWQDMVTKLHENNMEKFKETTTLINDLKKENLELKTKLSTQQVEDNNFEPIMYGTLSDFDNSNTWKTVPQELEVSAFKKETCALPNDHKSKLAMPQTETTQHNLKPINTISNPNLTFETLPQKEAHIPEEQKYALSNKQQVSLCVCKNSFDFHTNMCDCEKENNAKPKVIKEESLLENCEKQICEYNIAENIAKFEKSTVDQIRELTLLIDKCKMNPVYWNDKDYENNRTRYNNLISELVKNYMEVVNKCMAFTYCSDYMITMFAEIEKAINAPTFEENLKLLKKQVAKHKIRAFFYNHLACCNNDIHRLTYTLSDALKNVQEHIRDVFADYWENVNMMYLMIDETSKMNDAHDNDFYNNSQKQTEVQQKLKMLAIQQSKMQKQEKELEERIQELNLQQQSLNDERHRMREVDILREQLIRRKNLYDGKVRALLNEKLLLTRDQKIDSTDLLQKYRQKNMECEILQRELDQTKLEINAYKNQMSVYEEDFKQERKLKELLLEEKNKLDAELQKQVNYNKQLTHNLSSTARSTSERLSQTSPIRYCGLCRQYTSSYQYHGFGRCTPSFD
ncbi:spindle assembly checkpoint component MAD1-like isoform X2 [Odontomachus brunneus]|uniref:spindle assembly checkpoint component MAD1-like isoform X2 n=1 Tax=Odontomachus brunneus TaxID=486640 RepID=UPI0013F23828|nr:spindle assembly checkpoint component MAD1-like isoform X2 [Odontomachus brunneus]